MSLKITFLGHAGFLFDDGRNQLAVDPFLTGNPLAKHKPGDIACQYVALSHAHQDHFGDTLEIARKNDATVVAAFEICNYVSEKGISKVQPANPGGKIKTPFGWIAFTQAFHSSSYDGRYMGMACGLVINIDGTTIYHCGDTALFSDMKLIGEMYRPNLAMIPCGDRFTMGPEQATRAAELIKPKTAVPIHYRTFDALLQDANGFRPQGVEVKELDPGETWQYAG